MITKTPKGRARWRHYLIAATVLASPCVSGCATTTPADAAPLAAGSGAPGQLPGLPNPGLSLDEVVGLARAGQKPEALIARIRDAGAYYRLSGADVVSLAQKGLPMPVIDYIHTSERQFSAGLAGNTAAGRPQPMPVQARPKRPIPALYTGV